MGYGIQQGGSATSFMAPLPALRETTDLMGAMGEAAASGNVSHLTAIQPIAADAIQQAPLQPDIKNLMTADLANPQQQILNSDVNFLRVKADPNSPINRVASQNMMAAPATQAPTATYGQAQQPQAYGQAQQSQMYGQAPMQQNPYAQNALAANSAPPNQGASQFGMGQAPQSAPLVQQSPSGFYGQGQ